MRLPGPKNPKNWPNFNRVAKLGLEGKCVCCPRMLAKIGMIGNFKPRTSSSSSSITILSCGLTQYRNVRPSGSALRRCDRASPCPGEFDRWRQIALQLKHQDRRHTQWQSRAHHRKTWLVEVLAASHFPRPCLKALKDWRGRVGQTTRLGVEPNTATRRRRSQ
jgi:hypothetical protein